MQDSSGRDRQFEEFKAHFNNIVSSRQGWATGGLSQKVGGREDEKERRRRERAREKESDQLKGKVAKPLVGCVENSDFLILPSPS